MTLAYFVSDLHLKTIEERNSQILLRFFHSLLRSRSAGEQSATHLFLVGDIFDLWIGSHAFFIERFRPIVSIIGELIQAGIEVHFFEGNHDLYLKDFWEGQLGARVHSDARYFELAGRVLRVEHGDRINPDDRGYLFLRAFLRTGAMTWVAKHLPAEIVNTLGERASRASRVYTSTAKEIPKDGIVQLIRRHAERSFQERPFDLMITGNVHVQDDHVFSIGNREVRSINLGSWFDSPKAFRLSEDRSQDHWIELSK
jgi:UDP-2,3-diacylglucosamine hydrolase